MKDLVSKLRSPASLELGPPRTVAGGLKDMVSSTRGIALIAAARRSKAQDPEGGSGRPSLHLPEEVALDSRDPSPAGRRWPHASPGRDLSVERKARRKRSPCLSCVRLVGGHAPVSGPRGPGRQQRAGRTRRAWRMGAWVPGGRMRPLPPLHVLSGCHHLDVEFLVWLFLPMISCSSCTYTVSVSECSRAT